jgi:hypothetical protein
MEIEMDSNRQLFVLGHDIWSHIDRESVAATYLAIKEAEVLFPPYDNFDILVTGKYKDLKRFHNDDSSVYKDNETVHEYFSYKTRPSKNTFEYVYRIKKNKEYLSSDDIFKSAMNMGFGEEQSKLLVKEANHLAEIYMCTLIVLLATKNVDKEVEKVKKHGPKSKKRPKGYDYITTIKIGKITESAKSDGSTCSTVRPHLRSGHIRTQHFGPGNKEIKKIFIKSVFVNADEGWIENQRRAYVVKAA